MRPDRVARVALVALVLLFVAASPAQAWCRMTTSSSPPPPGMCPTGIPLEWHHPCTRYHIYGTGSRTLPLATVRDIFAVSFSQWESVDCTGVTALPGMPNLEAHLSADASQCDRSEYVSGGPNVSTVVFVQDWAARGYDASAYAVTTVWHSTRTGEIYDVDMEFNEDDHTYAVCPTPAGCTDGSVDLQNVVTHEAGHYFGLAHSSVSTASMFASSSAGEVGKRILKADDLEGFCTIYPPGHFDGVACDDTPRGGAALTCAVVDEGCGCTTPGAGRVRAPWLAVALVALVALGLVARRRRRRTEAFGAPSIAA